MKKIRLGIKKRVVLMGALLLSPWNVFGNTSGYNPNEEVSNVFEKFIEFMTQGWVVLAATLVLMGIGAGFAFGWIRPDDMKKKSVKLIIGLLIVFSAASVIPWIFGTLGES